MHSLNSKHLLVELFYLFEEHVEDATTMKLLLSCAQDEEYGTDRSRSIFNDIRAKNLSAPENSQLAIQYAFEEACAKTLYNLGRPSAAYDPDAQMWIVPLAVQLSKFIGLEDSVIINLLMSYKN